MSFKKHDFNFDKDTPIFQILQVWQAMHSNEVIRKHNKKQEKFILIQDRKRSLQILFDWFVEAKTPKAKVKENLVKIGYSCISKYPKRSERKGWAILVAKDVTELYNETYSDSLDHALLMVSILNGNAKSTFKGAWEQEEEQEEQYEQPQQKFKQRDDSEDSESPSFVSRRKASEFVPSGKKNSSTVIQDEILSMDEVVASLMRGE
jgi:hypothetical protein